MKSWIIAISALAVLMSSAVTLQAQTPTEQTPAATPPVTREADRTDDDMDWGWIGILGLIGLAGLAGRRRDDVVGTTRPRT